MILKGWVLGELSTNCFLLVDESSKEAVLIDPGCFHEDIVRFIESNTLKVKYIIATHGHIDHIGGVDAFKDRFGAYVVAHEKEVEMFSSVTKNLSLWVGRAAKVQTPHILVKDGDILRVGSIELHLIHTPGHTPGSISIWIPSEKIVIVGDLLFLGSVGRTDLPGGNMAQLLRSIRKKIFKPPPKTKVYPGHGLYTTIIDEMEKNPFLKKKSDGELITT